MSRINSGVLWKYGIMVGDASPVVIAVPAILLYRDRSPFRMRSGSYLLLRQS